VDRLPPPLLGFNNNVQHNGRVFHIQTEDSGIKYCRVVTHLFADGGRILQTCRTDYTQQVGRPDLIELIRQLMKDQHRIMFSALRKGEFDEVIRNTFKGPTQAELDASESPLSQRPQLRAQELPALTLRAPEDATSASQPPTEVPLVATRPSLRPKRQSSRPPASKSSRRPSNLDASSREATSSPRSHPSQIMTAPKQPALLPTVGSNDSARRHSNKSIFGDTGASEQSLDDVILSYLDDDTGEGKSRR
jgi:hypothetical protein